MSHDSDQFIHDFAAGEWPSNKVLDVVRRSTRRGKLFRSFEPPTGGIDIGALIGIWKHIFDDPDAQSCYYLTRSVAHVHIPFFSIDPFFMKARPLAGWDRCHFRCDLAWSSFMALSAILESLSSFNIMLTFARNLLPLIMPSVLHSDVNSPSHAATILLTMLFSRILIYALSIPPTINSDSKRYLTQLFTFLHFFYFLTLHFTGFTLKVSQLSLQASCASYFRHHNPELNPFPKLTFPKNRNWTQSHILISHPTETKFTPITN